MTVARRSVLSRAFQGFPRRQVKFLIVHGLVNSRMRLVIARWRPNAGTSISLFFVNLSSTSTPHDISITCLIPDHSPHLLCCTILPRQRRRRPEDMLPPDLGAWSLTISIDHRSHLVYNAWWIGSLYGQRRDKEHAERARLQLMRYPSSYYFSRRMNGRMEPGLWCVLL